MMIPSPNPLSSACRLSPVSGKPSPRQVISVVTPVVPVRSSSSPSSLSNLIGELVPSSNLSARTQLPAASGHVARSAADGCNPVKLFSSAGLHVHSLSLSSVVVSVTVHGPSAPGASIYSLVLFMGRQMLPPSMSSCKVSSSAVAPSALKVPVY